MIAKEFHGLHKLLSMALNTFRLLDSLSFASWFPTSVPLLRATAFGTMWRMAKFTLSGWSAAFDRLQVAAESFVGLVDYSHGRWSPGFWKTSESIVQRFQTVVEGKPVHAPQRLHQDLRRAAVLAERAVRAAAAEGRRPLPQREFVRPLQELWYPDRFEVTLQKRITA